MRKRKSAISSFLSLFLLLGVISNATKKMKIYENILCVCSIETFSSFFAPFFLQKLFPHKKKTLDFYSERELLYT